MLCWPKNERQNLERYSGVAPIEDSSTLVGCTFASKYRTDKYFESDKTGQRDTTKIDVCSRFTLGCGDALKLPFWLI